MFAPPHSDAIIVVVSRSRNRLKVCMHVCLVRMTATNPEEGECCYDDGLRMFVCVFVWRPE